MGRITVSGGLRMVQSYADKRDVKTKRTTLGVVAVFVGLWWTACAVYGLIKFDFPVVIFSALAVGVCTIGVHAAYKSRRPLLFVYILGVVVIMGFTVVGLIMFIIAGVFTLSLNAEFLVALIFDLALLLIEGFSVVLAYSLTKSLDPKHVVVLSNGGSESSQQEFTFSEGAGAVEMQSTVVASQQHQPLAAQQPSASSVAQAPIYQPQQPAMVAPGGMMGVYNPVTGTYGLPSVVSPYGPYGQVATMTYPLPHQGMGYSPSGTAVTYDYAVESRPVYENDIIGETTNSDTNPFIEK
jgi:hypothetical protein